MHYLIRQIEKVVTVVGIGAAMLLVPLVLATCYEVFSRYVMGEPTAWAYEIGYILTGSHFLLGLASTLKQDLQIRLDGFTGSMTPRTRAVIDTAAYAVMLPCYGLILFYALKGHRLRRWGWDSRLATQPDV